MSMERKGAPFTLEEVTQLATDVALERDGLIPTLIVEGNRDPVVGQFPELPPTRQGRVELMFAAGFGLAQSGQIDVLKRIFFITEGWIDAAQEDGLFVISPSEDAEHKEVIVISGSTIADSRTAIAMLDITRDKEGCLGEFREFEVLPDGTVTDNQLFVNAFIDGFRAGGSHVRLSPTSCWEDRSKEEFSDRPNVIGKPQRQRRRLRLGLFLP